ncbi:MAG: division/cell wall cluster transcriptional repressor MraZ [Oscillospiraceae bacterium]|jgi:MraZ protein|nr:division/cell wall cluster transcriptional repressor MraZ [Oscillospiraceae bacterium]
MEGVFSHSIDAKGRLFIPARLKDELGESFHVTISHEKCLEAYSETGWTEFTQKVEALPRLRQSKFRPFFAHAVACTLDSQGRILLPQQLRDFAGLKKNVAVVGAGKRAQFWDSDTWGAVDDVETSPENLLSAMEDLG